MRWGIVGSLGMLGSDLVKVLSQAGEEVHGFHRGNLNLEPKSEDSYEKLKNIDLIVNCVAYTKVDLAESDRDKAFFANATVPTMLAAAATALGSRLIHISTDYVFDGQGSVPYEVGAPKNPRSVYGETKSIGEDLVLEFADTQVVRTSWLYGRNGTCFPKSIAKALNTNGHAKVVSDQTGSPTHTMDVARFVHQLGQQEIAQRTLHSTSSGETSWFGFAVEVAKSLGLSNEHVSPILTDEISQIAARPKYSVLAQTNIPGFSMPNWQDAWDRAADHVLRA